MRNKLIETIKSFRPEIEFSDSKDTDLFGVLDSLDIIFLVEEIEKQFSIKIDAEQIIPENFATLYTLEEFVKGHAL